MEEERPTLQQVTSSILQPLNPLSVTAVSKLLKRYLRHLNRIQWRDKCTELLQNARVKDRLTYEILLRTAPVYEPWFHAEDIPKAKDLLTMDGELRPASLSNHFSTTHYNMYFSNRKHWSFDFPIFEAPDNRPSVTFGPNQSYERKNMQMNISDTQAIFVQEENKQFLMTLFKGTTVRVSKKPSQGSKKRKDPPEGAKQPKKKAPSKAKKLLYDDESLARMDSQKRKRELKDHGIQKPSKKEKPTEERLRSISFRLSFGSKKMQNTMEQWCHIYSDIVQHTSELIEDYATRGLTVIKEIIRDRVVLTQAGYYKLNSTDRNSLEERDRRKQYFPLPSALQVEAVDKTFSSWLTAQKNLQNGTITDYSFGQNNKTRYKWLSVLSRKVARDAQSKFGVVNLFPEDVKYCDTGLYLKDRLLPQAKDNRNPQRKKTKKWGNILKFGWKEGNTFLIRWDTERNKWYLVMNYDALSATGPYQSFDVMPDWYRRKREFVYNNQTRPPGAACSIDPGANDPMTVFDATANQFYSLMSDFPAYQKLRYKKIQRAQDVLDNVKPAPCSLWKPDKTVEERLAIKDKRHLRKVQKKLKGKKRKRRRKRSEEQLLNEKLWSLKPFVHPHPRNIRNAWDKIETETKLVHNRVCNFLISNNDTVVLPEFMTGTMISKRRKKFNLPKPEFEKELTEGGNETKQKEVWTGLHKTTRTKLARYGHLQQRQRLVAKALADPYQRKWVGIDSEEWTTKQVTKTPSHGSI